MRRGAWDDASDEEKLQTVNLPHFDADIFEEITGIDVREEKFEGNGLYDKGQDDEMVEIDGKKWSKNTVKEALKKHAS